MYDEMRNIHFCGLPSSDSQFSFPPEMFPLPGYRLHERGSESDRLPSHPAGQLNMRQTNAQSLCMPYGARQGSLRVKLIILIRPILQNLVKKGDWIKCQKDGGGRDSGYRVTAPGRKQAGVETRIEEGVAGPGAAPRARHAHVTIFFLTASRPHWIITKINDPCAEKWQKEGWDRRLV